MQKDASLTYTEAHERGGETELQFFTAMQATGFGSPRWFRDMRHTTREQDLKGVDAVAVLDVGEVPVQIKSSHAGLEDHRLQYGDTHCIIVFCPKWPLQAIRSKTFDLLYRWRVRMLPQRQHRRCY